MRFRFSLEAVLRVARVRETTEWSKCQSIQARMNVHLAELKALAATQTSARRQLTDHSAGKISAAWLHVMSENISAMARREDEIRKALQQLAILLQGQQRIYIAARQKREVLSRLEETRYEEYCRDLTRQEQAALDDMFLAHR